MPIRSLADLVERSDLVVVATVVRQLDDYIPEGRYWERGGRLASVRPELPVDNAVIPEGSYLKEIIGESLASFEARVKAIASAAPR